MPELVAIAYRDETAADRAVEELRRCWEDLLTDPDAASVLVCERDGGWRLTTSSHAAATAAWSKFWGALLEALLLEGEGPVPLEASFRSRLRSLLRPGTSALLLAAPRAGTRRALQALSHFEGEALSCPLGDDLPQPWSIDPKLDR